MKIKAFLLSFILLVATAEGAPSVLVSVAPHKFFIEKIAGDTVKVILLVPAGASSHTYEPTPKQVISTGKAEVWFGLGEPFESRVLPALKNNNPDLLFVDLREDLDLICVSPHEGCSCCQGGVDPHIWLSPKLAQQQATVIAATLSKKYPEHAAQYEASLKDFVRELQQLDQETEKTLSTMKPRLVMVSHPAYGYLARDYNFKQLSIEFEGKDPTPQQLTNLLRTARKMKIQTVYIQPQYSGKGARIIANQIGAKIIILDPYSEDYINMMHEVANQFSKGHDGTGH